MRVPLPVRVVPSIAFRAWLTPPPQRSANVARPRGEAVGLSPVFYGGVPGYEIGSGPVVLAAHGWGGRAAQMFAVATRLADEGYRVVIPELPGRAGGTPTDIKEAAATVQAVVDDAGKPELVIAHSFAAMVLRLAFGDGGPRRVVFVAPALDVRDQLRVFADRLRLLPWTRRGLRTRLEAWDPSLWPSMASLFPDQLPGSEIVIVHDPADRETPFARSAELAAIRRGTSILALEKAGHSRILSHPDLVDLVADFVSDRAISEDDAA